MIAYISIGNSDDKLTQKEWAQFEIAILTRIKPLARWAHGEWFSTPFAAWQNACWCLEFPDDPVVLTEVREVLAEIRDEFRQESIAFAVAQTEFI
ncbi:MAG TPA: hypothetical protein VGR98_28065 [Streptosporangiaceae bacterium]|nr:hypothetical protein [Streptosporangiaceae bacterium]